MKKRALVGLVGLVGLVVFSSPLYAANGDLIVDGNIKLGNSSVECSSTTDGSIRYNATTKNMELCNGTNWLAVTTAQPPQPQDSYDSYTKLLLHMDGVNGSPTFTDSALAKTITTNGNVLISSSQAKFGQSAYFDGTGYLTTPQSTDVNFGSGNFTIDLWLYYIDTAPTSNYFTSLVQQIPAYSGQTTLYGFGLVINAGIVMFYASTGGSSWDIVNGMSLGAIPTNSWIHIAIVRNGNTFTGYINGTAISSATSSATLADSTGNLMIGSHYTTAYRLVGYIDELRISKGIARWTANFTPPTAPY